ncbi:MAG: metallophosphoesterase family protein [Planctomycetota bacterium]
MNDRTIAIGDIHGCRTALQTLLDHIQPTSSDTIVTLGDYVDRGEDSRGVLDLLMELESHCHLVTLLGNHDAQMLAALVDAQELERWLAWGAVATLQSYSKGLCIEAIPAEHIRYVRDRPLYFESDRHFFVHANYDEQLSLAEQDEETLLWLSLRDHVPGPHCSGKQAIVGHTAQRDYEILNLGHLLCLDTGCCYGGWLTAYDVSSGRIWQANKLGAFRDGTMPS